MFAQRMRELRKERGYSQFALAQQLGLTQQAVGKWETGRATPDPQTLAAIASFFHISTDYLLGCDTVFLPKTKGSRVRIIGTVRAGYGALALEEDYGTEYADVKNPEQYFYLLVQGDSMEPRISEGDLALIRQQSTLENGDLGVVIYADGEATLKKYIRSDNTVILQPFNPVYQSQIIAGEELERLFIVGKVVETKTKW